MFGFRHPMPTESRGPRRYHEPRMVRSAGDDSEDGGAGRVVLFGLLAVGLGVLLLGAATATGVVSLDDDADDDGLADERERTLGLDPRDPDTDGDLLRDDWEVRGRTDDGLALPRSDPRHKDLYVQFNYGTRIPGLTARERRGIRRIWADMPVDNPDGEQGIRIHIADDPPLGGHLDRSVQVEGERSRKKLVGTFYTDEILGDRRCVYHQVVLGHFDDGTTVGYGDTPGYFSIVEGARIREGSPNNSVRTRYITHELLHNVVGHFDDGTDHAEEGWLSHRAIEAGKNRFLSDKTRRKLNDVGFVSSVYYDRICE